MRKLLIILLCATVITAFGQRYKRDTCRNGDTAFITHSWARAIYYNTHPICYADYRVYQIDTVINISSNNKKQQQ